MDIRDIPPSVLAAIRAAVENTICLASARATDNAMGGNGRYEWETYKEHKERLQRAYKTITKARDLAASNGTEIEEIYEITGWPQYLSDRAKAYGTN